MPLGLGSNLSRAISKPITPGIVTDNLVLKHQYNAGSVVPCSDGAAYFDGTTAASNSIRGLFGSGSSGTDNQIEYVTIATLGNAVDFGDLTYNAEAAAGGASPTRVIFAGGTVSGGKNIIDYVQIMTLGNAIDFGDRTIAKYGGGCVSNGHGGLG